ncbi:Ubiquitin carboxyl-terminal hydrolase [Venustampulla echinocandica]|uniref:Ubiquitin carboxyl-terminal hydrolase n=1 Tax=Venustampulla echinocandica TaxID=2656787 RepID=A0A370T9L0_9HELO|nr:Ubiquitin carboxyl-terminal hydrolase [Venustampulla echinocandica]RDL30333.1 Ubiquitin carboxyl-terminal hydrolase [Venustampulla echinocandica]
MPIPVEIINGKKTVTVLENNPEVMNALSARLGLSPELEFHDVYSLTDQSLLSLIPRPVLALLVIIPMTPAWYASRTTEDADKPPYAGSGPEEPVVWFKQTIGHACGSIGLLHCLINGPAKDYILPDSTLMKLREQAIPLKMDDRAKMLYDSKEFEDAHQSVAEMGDTIAPSAAEADRLPQHFVAFIKGGDGRLWELEGGRKGPLERGVLEEGEDLLSGRALELGLGRVIEMEKSSGGNELRFSCIALTRKSEP